MADNSVCSDKPKIPRGKTRGRPGACFRKGRRAGFKAGIDAGEKKLKFGTGLTEAGVNRLTKDQLRDIVLRRRRSRGQYPTTIPQGFPSISKMSKAQLSQVLLGSLRNNNELRQ